jgi:hypothetical protein
VTDNVFERLKKEKQGLINAAWLELLVHEHRTRLYRDIGGGDPNNYLWAFKHEIMNKPECRDCISQPVDPARHPPEIYQQIILGLKQLVEKMASGDYEAPLPRESDSLLFDLHAIWHVYEVSHYRYLSVRKAMCLDLACMKLLSAAQRRIGKDLTKFEREEFRKAEGIKIKQQNKAKNNQRIIETFHVLQSKGALPKEVSLNKAANMIRENLNVNPLPSVDTVRRALKNDEQVRKYLVKQM